MTMPHLTNCPHSADSWCLSCVAELAESQTRTSVTPCMPDCIGGTDHDAQRTYVIHAEGCPHAKPAEPPASCVKECRFTPVGLSPAVYHAPGCPKHAEWCDGCQKMRDACICKPAEPQRIKHGVNCDCKQKLACELAEEAENKRKPAEPPACACGADDYNMRGCGPQFKRVPHALNCPKMTAAPQSEPPIDFGAASDLATHAVRVGVYPQNLARAYISIKVERDALSATVVKLRAAVAGEEARAADLSAERDALKATLLERCQTIDRLVKERDYERDQNAVLCQRAVAFDAHMTRENSALKARVEELEGLIVFDTETEDQGTTYWYGSACVCVLCEERRAIRARKEQEASNGK